MSPPKANRLLPEPKDDTSAQNQGATGLEVVSPDIEQGSGLHEDSLRSGLLTAINDPRRGYAPFLQIAAAWAGDRDNRISELTKLISEKDAQLENKRSQLEHVREANAAMKAILGTQAKHKPLVVFALVAGPTLISIGIDQTRSNSIATGVTLIIVGILLLGAVYFSYSYKVEANNG